MSLTEIAIKRPTIVVVIFTILGILGAISYTKLNYDLFPKMDIPVISVQAQYPGAAANEVESSVTKKLEDALSSLENVKSMQSSSMEGVSSIIIELQSNADVNLAIEEAQRKVNAIESTLPTGVKTPSLYKFSSEDIPILMLSVSSNIKPTELYHLTNDQIKSQISKVNGVGQVTLIGGNQREIRVNINRDKLKEYKLSVPLVYQAISNAHLESPTGKIQGTLNQYTVRISGKVKSVDELSNIIIQKGTDGSMIKLSDVAEIEDGMADIETINRLNNGNSIGLIIQKQTDANSVKVCKDVKEQLSKIEKTYAQYHIKFNVASDTSEYTLASANAVMFDLQLAIILVAIVMFLFLHSIRNSLIVMVSIPASIISVFVGMYVFGFSLNMLTLMALSLVVGILVDDSIVVLENIHRHLEMGEERRKAAINGRNEIGFTAVAITMVDVVVFLPLALVSGMIGNMLREFSLVVVFSTLMSLFVSFTITPLLASRFSKLEKRSKTSPFGRLAYGFESLYNQLVGFYEKTLRWCLKHRSIVYTGVTVLIIGSLSLVAMGFIGTEFIAHGDRGEFKITLEGEAYNTPYQTNMLTQRVEQLLASKPEITKVYTNVGYSSSGFSLSGESNKAEITVTMVSKEKRKVSVEDYSLAIKNEILTKVPGLKVTTTPTTLTGGSNEAPIQVLLRSSDIDRNYAVADQVMKIVKSIPGTSDVELSVEKSKPEIKINLDRNKMSLLGLSVSDVSKTLYLAFAGNTDLQYPDKGDDYNIDVKLDQFNRNKVEDVGSLPFINQQGQVIELKQFAQIYQAMGPSKLERYDRISSLTVKANVFGRPVGTVGSEIQAAVASKVHASDVSIDYKGELENQAEAFGSLGLALMAAIIFVYLVMVALYNSYSRPFVVMFSIPVAIIGALTALALAKQTISIFSIIGMIMLVGLVAKNAILLVDFTNHLKEKGMPLVEALVAAGKERMRPILMTTLSMVFGMLPIALATGSASEIKNGMAWVIIGGLLSSLMLTLLLVPSVYMTFDKINLKLKKRFHQKTKKEIPFTAE